MSCKVKCRCKKCCKKKYYRKKCYKVPYYRTKCYSYHYRPKHHDGYSHYDWDSGDSYGYHHHHYHDSSYSGGCKY